MIVTAPRQTAANSEPNESVFLAKAATRFGGELCLVFANVTVAEITNCWQADCHRAWEGNWT